MTLNTPDRLREVELFAWIGEDELGSGVIGIKQGIFPHRMIPLVATSAGKINGSLLLSAMSEQALDCGKKIYLCRFSFREILWTTHDGTPL